MRVLRILCFVLLSVKGFVFSQNEIRVNNELTLQNYLSIVTLYHPLSKQADLVSKMGDAQRLAARGGFDPNVSSTLDHKQFNDKNYWFLWESKLEIPTWYGIEILAGYQYLQGDYFDTHERTPDIGLPYAGISASLGKNMFMDDRMAALKKAKIYSESADIERQLLLNDLYFEAIQAYLDWTYKYYQLKVYKTATKVAEERFVLTRNQFLLGEKPAMDTVEMLTVYQSRLIGLSLAENEFKNSQLKLSNFLWFENNTPIILPDTIIPNLSDSLVHQNLFTQDSLVSLITNLSEQNLVLQQLNLKQSQLKIDRTLKLNKVLPQLDVTYNFLYNESQPVYITNNYKFGVQFKFPLFFRKEIGDLKLAKFKLQDNQLKTEYKTLELRNKINAAYNDYITSKEQLLLNEAMLTNYKTLFDAETIKFLLGESTVFMVNSRETKYLESLIKVEEVKTKVVKSLFYIYWTSSTMRTNQN